MQDWIPECLNFTFLSLNWRSVKRFCGRAAVFQQCLINTFELMKQREVSADREQAHKGVHARAQMGTAKTCKSTNSQILFLLCGLNPNAEAASIPAHVHRQPRESQFQGRTGKLWKTRIQFGTYGG